LLHPILWLSLMLLYLSKPIIQVKTTSYYQIINIKVFYSSTKQFENFYLTSLSFV
jgi:hypothetical protein